MTTVETRLEQAHVMALSACKTLAEKVRYACEHVPEPTTQDVRDWLERYGVKTKRPYTSTIVNQWRRERGMSDTGDLPTLTPEMLAELDRVPVAPAEVEPEPSMPATAEHVDPAPDASKNAVVRGVNASPATGVDVSRLWQRGEAPDPAAAREAFTRAREMAQLQREYKDDLEAVLSPSDLAADDAKRRKIREAQREREVAAELDKVKAEAEAAEHERKLKGMRRRQREMVATMKLKVTQETDPALALSRLNLARWLAPAVALIPAVFGAVAEAVNVGTTMGKLSPDTGWINWSLGPVITIPLVAIMIAQFLGAVPIPGKKGDNGKVNRFVALELVLFGLAAIVNVGPHLLIGKADGGGMQAAVPWLIVPVGFALSMYLVPALRSHLNAEFVRAAENAREHLAALD